MGRRVGAAAHGVKTGHVGSGMVPEMRMGRYGCGDGGRGN